MISYKLNNKTLYLNYNSRRNIRLCVDHSDYSHMGIIKEEMIDVNIHNPLYIDKLTFRSKLLGVMYA